MKTSLSMCKAPAIIATCALCLAAYVWNPGRLIARPRAAQATAPAQQAAATQQPSTPEGKTAGQEYMNVEVLKDIPASQLIPAMRYITVALGVRCDYCHDVKNFDNDDKPEKQRARNMMKMMLAINSVNFNGRREVTCYTCHHGVAKAASIPVLPEVAATTSAALMGAPAPKPMPESANSSAAPAASLPTIDDILEKYVLALGGAGAIQENTSSVEKGTLDLPAWKMHASIEIYRKVPDKVLTILHTPNGEMIQGYNGTIAWEQRPDGKVSEQTGDDLANAKRWATFNVGVHLKQEYSRLQVSGIEKVGGRDAYCVIGWREGANQERLFFDTQTGLLLRNSERLLSPLGDLPQETDYEDYRDVGGVKVPFTVRVVRVDGTMIYKWEQIKANVPLDDSRFDKPVEKAGEKPSGKPSTP